MKIKCESFTDYLNRKQIETQENWEKYARELPFIKWPSGWLVKAIPPFGGALVRYIIKDNRTPKNEFVSVYFDAYDRLGYVGQPYWEVFPYEDDTFRCYMNEIDKLMKAIQISLNEISNHPLNK